MEQKYKDKKVLILGLGINQGGLGATKFFINQGAKVKVTDLKTADQLKISLDQLKEFPQIEYTLGEHKFEDIDWADIIIKNPGVKPGNQYIEYAVKQGKQVEMDMGIFLEFVKPSQVIGITGTKGKSTTSSMIYEVLKRHFELKDHIQNNDDTKQRVVFAGNIGKSVLDTIPYVKEDTLVVLELSSFQLDAWNQHNVSPKWAVITNIFPDHLNYYGTMEKYIEAKRWIASNQDDLDFLFLNRNAELTNNREFLEGLQGNIIHFAKDDLPLDFQPKLPGEHNLSNMAAAYAVTRSLGVRPEIAIDVIKNFQGVEFRLQLIKEWNEIKIYNDTAATDPGAGVEALKSLPNSILITGGVNKNLPYDEFAEAIDQLAKSVYFLEGDATDEIINKLKVKSEKLKVTGKTYNNFEDILNDIKPTLNTGDVILFSPGAASFNLFQNEFDRGRKFNQAVEKLFN